MLRTLLVFGIILAAVAGSIASPFLALLSYLWFALFRPQEWVWIDISQFRFSLVLGVLLLVRSLGSGYLPDLRHRISWGMMLFLLTGLVAQSNAVRPDVGWEWLGMFGRLIVVAMLLVSLTNTERRLQWLTVTIAASLGMETATAGLKSLLAGGAKIYEGNGGSFIDNNGYALAAAMAAPLLMVAGRMLPPDLAGRIWASRALKAAALLTVCAAILTYSRGGLLAVLAGALVYIMLLTERPAKTLVALVCVALVAAPFVPLPKGYADRMETIVTYDEVGEESALSRIHFWRVALDMVRDHPLGIGVYNFNYTYDAYDYLDGRYGRGRSVHNSHLQALAENGFIGFAIWVWLFVTSLRTCFRIRREVRGGVGRAPEADPYWVMSGGLIVSMVSFCVGGTFIALSLNDVTWLIFGLVAATENLHRKRLEAADPIVLPGRETATSS